MSLTLQVTLQQSGLLGSDYEYNPRIEYWTSWKDHRTHASVPFGGILNVKLPVSSDVRGDERIQLKLMACTKHSGIKSIDAQEHGHEERDVQAGIKDLPLIELLAAAQERRTLDVHMTDPMLYTSKLKEGEQAAFDYAYKGTLQLRPFSDTTSLLSALKVAASKESLLNLMYGSPMMIAAMQKMQDLLLNAYTADFYGRVDKKGHVIGPATYPLGKEKTLEHMHLPLYVSEFGVLPPVALMQHRIDLREHPTTPEERKRYGPTRESALLAEKLLTSSARCSGLTPDMMVRANRAQETQSHSDPSLSGAFLDSEMVVANMATRVANSILYTKDYRYPNSSSVNVKGKAPVVAAATSQWNKSVWKMLGARKRATAKKDTDHDTDDEEGPDVEVESLDPVALWGIARGDDCEGSGVTACHVLMNLPRLATVVTEKEAPLLHVAARIVSRRMVMASVSSVSAAYVDTSGNELSKEAQKAIKDLPLIGDELDRRRKVGGHAHGLWPGAAAVRSALEAGGVNVKTELPTLGARDFAAWEHRLPTLVLEGTAAIDPLVLPVGEVAQAVMATRADADTYEARTAAQKSFLHDMVDKPLVQHAHPKGLSFYTAKQDPQRRVSNFYMGFSHLLSPELYAMNPRYGQLSFINPKTQTRGVEVATALRMSLSKQEVGLVPTFGRITRNEWATYVRPVMACIQNQMPLAAIDMVAAERVGHPLSPALLTSFGGNQLPVHEALTRLVKSVAPAPMVEAKQGTLTFTMQAWQLGEQGTMRAVVEHLQELQRDGHIARFETFSDKQLPQGEDVVTTVVSF